MPACPRGCCQQPRSPREGLGIVTVPWLYHVFSALAILPQRSQGILLHRFGNCLQSNHKKCDFLLTGCEFSRVPSLLALAIVEAKSGNQM